MKNVNSLTMHIDRTREIFPQSVVNVAVLCRSNWYFGPLKHRLAYVVSALRYWPPTYRAEMTYTLACEGCQRCYVPPPKPQWRWWHVFLPPRVEGICPFTVIVIIC